MEKPSSENVSALKQTLGKHLPELAAQSQAVPVSGSPILQQLMSTIVQRRENPSETSYTSRLLLGGDAKIGEKITEEAAEVVDAATKLTLRNSGADCGHLSEKEGQRPHLIYESADLLYHLWVILAHHGVQVQEVEEELARRFGISGLDEKASRDASPEG